MADLTAEQKEWVREWAESGATLNDIQSKLKTELQTTLTYMECRLLVMELGLSLKDKTVKAVVAAPVEEAVTDRAVAAEAVVDAEFDEALPEEVAADAAGSTLFVMEADELAVPGMLVSGTAMFSDGTQAKWSLDQMGRLNLKTDKTGYQPPAADVPKFQQGLEKILVKMGLY
jgi:hypothetical protein